MTPRRDARPEDGQAPRLRRGGAARRAAMISVRPAQQRALYARAADTPGDTVHA
jgi:hypothetical protein